MGNISNEFYQREPTIIISFLVIFEYIASKLGFSPFLSLPSVATDDRKQFQCRRIAFNGKTRPLFLEFN